jgi:Fe-S-cluster-containing dehydrogenase component
VQKGFTFDANRCTGCEACRIGCSIENRLDPRIDWRRIHSFNPRHEPGVPSLHNSLACNHCLEPACMEHCPALAYSKHAVTGAVTIDAEKCIGCKYCSWACPYDAPRFNMESGLMEKCTFCSHRLAEGREPACVALCPTGALGFADHDPSQAISRIPGFTQTEIGPAIRFTALRSERPPAMRESATASPVAFGSHIRVSSRIGLRTEWTLLCFTLVAAILVAWVAAGALTGLDPRPEIVLPAGLAAMALSTLHLGRKFRAWRAVLNLRRSWLSREVVLFPGFLAWTVAASLSAEPSDTALRLAAAMGLAALFAMDRVYGVTRTPGLAVHSAQVLLTGLLFTGLIAGIPFLAVSVAIVKMVLYVGRKARFVRQGLAPRPLTGLLRLALLFPAWLAPTATEPTALRIWVLLAVATGEVIDRAEYYLELDPPSPEGQLARDLEESAGRTIPEAPAGRP